MSVKKEVEAIGRLPAVDDQLLRFDYRGGARRLQLSPPDLFPC